MDIVRERPCGYYKPIYRERVIEYEDKFGNPYEYREELLFAEFCYMKEDFILSELSCSRCELHKKADLNAARPLLLVS